MHLLSQQAEAYEVARKKIAAFINAKSDHEVILPKAPLIVLTLLLIHSAENFERGDEVLISAMEHHSNIVPWQIICEERKAVLKESDSHQRRWRAQDG